MEKNPKAVNPLDAGIKTYPGQSNGDYVAPLATDLLPSIFRTEINKKVISAIAEDLFQPSSMQDLNFSVGRPSTKLVVNEFLPHPTAKRQLEPGLLVYKSDGPDTLSADELAQAWGFNDRLAESPVSVSVLDLPMDPDKFVNWSDYYWVEQGMPVIQIESSAAETFNIQRDIIGKPYYTTITQKNGKQLELKNGMRLIFQESASPDILSANSDLEFAVVSNGELFQSLNVEFAAYDTSLVTVLLDGNLQSNNYYITGNSIKWITTPTVGQVITIHCPHYYITTDADSKIAQRRWQVAGVGSATGIQLLGRTHQYTNTVYSKATQTVWDQTAVPWDSVEWDGTTRGINAKHYILEKVGAENRNSFSRINVWYHRDTIQTIINFLEINFADIVDHTNKASRPIVEFDNSLELYKHGTGYTAWPNLVVEQNTVTPSSLLGLPLVDSTVGATVLTLNTNYVLLLNALQTTADLTVTVQNGTRVQSAFDKRRILAADLDSVLAADNKLIYEVFGDTIKWVAGHAPTIDSTTVVRIDYRLDGVLLSKLRILWLGNGAAGSFANQIISFRNNNATLTSFILELPEDQKTVVVDTPYASNNYYLSEFYWESGIAKLAQFKTTLQQKPRFELYDANHQKLSSSMLKPLIINSTIIELAEGTMYDNESGYNLKFLPSQFTDLSTDNTIRNSMYDIVYNHTMHNIAYYSEASTTKAIPGPYSFRRIAGGEVANELSCGYRRAWFKLKSWAIQKSENLSASTITIDASAWPTYEWAIALQNDRLTVHEIDQLDLDSDQLDAVVDNHAVGARGEVIRLDLYIPNLPAVATINGIGITELTANIVDNRVEFTMPANAPDLIVVTIGAKSFKMRVIDVKADPRNVQVKLNGLPTDYSIVALKDGSNNVTAVTLTVPAAGNLEIWHQGIALPTDHITAIPGFDLNPMQTLSLGEFTPSRVVNAMYANISANKGTSGRSWIDCPQVLTMNGALLADNSAIRAAWASLKLAPTIQDVAIARSLSAWRWHRRFVAKLEYNFNLTDFESTPVRSSLDRILEELLLGVTYSSPDAVSGVALTTNSMNHVAYVASGSVATFAINTGAQTLYLGTLGPDHIYVYVNGDIVSKSNYAINPVTGAIEFVIAPTASSSIEIFHSNADAIYSGIPASPAKLGLCGIFQPGVVTETWGTNSRKFIQRHDGSRITIFGTDESDLRNRVVLELETRIFNTCIHPVATVNRQERFRNIQTQAVLDAQSRAQVAWYALNNLEFRNRDDYVAGDPWTWNYNGLSWRALYIQSFGTDQLHATPWKALGFDNAPSWWNAHYSWTDSVKRTALEFALVNGIISEPSQPVTVDPTVCRRFATFPVTPLGALKDPSAWGMVTPSADAAMQPWEIGAIGPCELAWRRSPAGQWATVMQSLDDYRLVNEFIDDNIDPFLVTIDTNSPTAKGVNTLAPGAFLQNRPTMGIGAMLFEAYREFNLAGEEPLLGLMSISVRLQFGFGGFSDGAMTLKMYYNKNQNGTYVPEEDYFMTLSNGVALPQLRYSAVRIEKSDSGFRVYGFDPSHREFTVLAPSTASKGLGAPSTRRSVVTSNGTFIEYLEWESANITVPYGTYIDNKQDLFTFLLGLGEHQKKQGLILDSINSRGTVTDWRQAALDAFAWIDENWSSNHYCVIGVATTDGLKFSHTRGTLDRLDADLGRTGSILFSNGRSALASELLITRDFEPNTDKITAVIDEQILFADFRTRDYDHIVYVNLLTKFGDLVADLQTGHRLDVLSLSARRTAAWSGRPHARGVVLQDAGLLPGFDSLVGDIIDSHRPEQNAFDVYKSAIAKSDVVPIKNSVIPELIQNKTVAHLYQQGLQSAAGTNLAINALFRDDNIDIPGRAQDIVVNEQWLFNTGEFGNLQDQKIWEVEIRRSDVTTNRQVIRLSKSVVDKLDDNIIDMTLTDRRWITKPTDPFNFAKIIRQTATTLDQTQDWLPSAGVAELFDVDIQKREITSITIDDFRNIDQSTKPENLNISYYDTLTTKDIFNARGYSRYVNYVAGDLVWQSGELLRVIGPTGTVSGITSYDFETVTIDGRLLPSIWVTDYAFSISNRKGTNYKGVWTPGTVYAVNDLVFKNGLYYTCTLSHTAADNFIQSRLDTLSVVDGGEGHSLGDVITFESVTGHGATASILEIISGKIKSITVTQPGADYNTQQSYVSINGNRISNSFAKINFKETLAVDAVTPGIVTKIKPTAPAATKFVIGNNYTPGSATATLIGAGSNAIITPIIEDQIQTGFKTKTGIIQSWELPQTGANYSVGDIVRVENIDASVDATFRVTQVGSTSTATATASIANGSISAINVASAGAGYTATPTITIGAPDLSATPENLFVSYVSGLSPPLYTSYSTGNLVAWIGDVNSSAFVLSPAQIAAIKTNYIRTALHNNNINDAQIDSTIDSLISSINPLLASQITPTYIADYATKGPINSAAATFDYNEYHYTKGTVHDSAINWTPGPLLTLNTSDKSQIINSTVAALNLAGTITDGSGTITSSPNTTALTAEVQALVNTIYATFTSASAPITLPVSLYNYSRARIVTPRQAVATAVLSANSIASITIVDAGAGYTIVPSITVSAPPALANGRIVEVTLLTGGESYVVGTQYNLIGTAGTGAKIRPTVVTLAATTTPLYDNGVITGFTIANGGKNYGLTGVAAIVRVNRTPTVVFPDSGVAEYRRAYATVLNGSVTGITITPTDTGNVPNILSNIAIQIVGNGTGALAIPVITNNKLTGATITNPGTGYTTAFVRIIDPYWAPDQIEVNVLLETTSAVTGSSEVGKIDSITILDSIDNHGFTSAAAVSIIDPTGSGTGAVASVAGIANGVISRVTPVFTDLTGGSGYSGPPVVTVSGGLPSHPAVLTASIKSYWTLKNSGYGWNILQTFAPMYVEEACPNALVPGLNESKISFANPHGLAEGEYFVMAGANDGNYDKLHQVKAIVDDYNLTIAARSTSDQNIFNLVAFKLLPVKFDTTAEYEQSKSNYNWKAGMKAYVDKDDNEVSTGTQTYNFKIYKFQTGTTDQLVGTLLNNVSQDFIDTPGFYKAQLVDTVTQQLLGTIEIYDPYKGIVIDDVAQYVNYRLPIDPAVYNVTDLGTLDEYIAASWDSSKLGQLWWDISRVRYIEYEQGTLEYRAMHWGQQAAESEVRIYEWVSSSEIPAADTYGILLDYSSGVGQVRYAQVNELTNTGAIVIKYYYWQRFVSVLPTVGNRPYTAAAIEATLQNPDANKVTWVAPIDSESDSASFLLANADVYLAGRDSVILRIEQNVNPEQKHDIGVLVTEGQTGTVIPDYLYGRLRDSLVGHDNYRHIQPISKFVPGNSYAVGDIISCSDFNVDLFENSNYYSGLDMPILPATNSTRTNVKQVWVNNDSSQFGIFKVQRAISAADSTASHFDAAWAQIGSKIALLQAGIVKDLLEDNRCYAVIEAARQIPDSRLHPSRRYGNEYVPYPQTWFSNLEAARRTFIESINDRLLNIDVVSKSDWDKNLRTWSPLLGKFIAREYTADGYYTAFDAKYTIQPADQIKVLINAVATTEYTVTDSIITVNAPLRSNDTVRIEISTNSVLHLDPEYGKANNKLYIWDYVDYVVNGYVPGQETVKIQSFNELPNYPNATRFAIVNSSNVVLEVYNKTQDIVDLIYRKNGSIQFKDIWKIDGWDTTVWDFRQWNMDYSEMFSIILQALRDDIFTGADLGYFNLVFFDMVRESLSQVPHADWVSKSTYLSVDQTSSNSLEQTALYYDKKDALIKQYLNEVKPYHSKFIDKGTFNNALKTIAVAISESVELTVTEATVLVAESAAVPTVIDRARNGTTVTESRPVKILNELGHGVIVSTADTTRFVVEEG